LRLKKVISREHVDLQGEDHGVEWPKNLQVKYVKEVESNKTTHSSGGRMESSKAVLDSTAATEAASAMAAAVIATPHSTNTTPHNESAPGSAKPGGAPNPEATSLIKNLRQTHSDWDRRKNDYRGCLAKAGANPATNISHIEQELKRIIEEGDALDAMLMEHNVFYIATGDLTHEGKQVVKESATTLFTLCKTGNSKMSALKTMMKA
jgi:hypothetical protein